MLAIIGTLPPPVHGMSVITQSVRDRMVAQGKAVLVINTSAASLRRSLYTRLSRVPRFLWGFIRIVTSNPSAIYIGVSGDYGQLYDIIFVVIARLKRLPLFLHHHSFGYVEDYRCLTQVMTRLSGTKSTHFVQSVRMGQLLAKQYGMKSKIVAASNIGILHEVPAQVQRCCVRTIGFLSNVSREKGIYIYLDLMDALKENGVEVFGRIAGPFQDRDTESKVRARLRVLPNVEYVGPKYGKEKADFYRSIDVFVFPTMFEAEGLVNHEAMSFGVPVIAFGRGCIPEIIRGSGGVVVDPSDDFVRSAMEKIVAWQYDQADYRECSIASRAQFERLLDEGTKAWDRLIQGLSKVS